MDRFNPARGLEPALCIERLRTCIGGRKQFARFERLREERGLFYQLAPDPAAPKVRLDERAVEIGRTIITRHDDSKTRRRAPVFEHDNQSRRYVIGRQLQRRWMLEGFRPGCVPLHRRTALQVLQRLTL